MNQEEAKKWAGLFREQLKEIMDEWAEHAIDPINGGYITDFGEDWQLMSLRKNIWAQARQTYMFAAYAMYIGTKEKWLKLSKIGRDFLVQHAYAGDGRWYYEVSVDGKEVQEGTTTIFTDLFVLLALSQYAYVSGDQTDYEIILETFEKITYNLANPDFKEIKPHQWEKGIVRYSPYMIAVHSLMTAELILDKKDTEPIIKEYINKLLNFFGGNTSGFLLESLKENGEVWNTPEGRIVNAGHVFEGMWFCIDYARKNSDKDTIDAALKIINKTAEEAIDKEYGGVIYQFSCFKDKEIVNTRTDVGQVDDKIDWVNCESLYAFALAAVFSKDDQSIERFRELNQFCQTYFRNEKGGDWYPALKRDGTPLRKNKGGKHRVAFHVPRALMNLCMLFELIGEGEEV